MSRPTSELENILRLLIGEHQKLLQQVEAQHAAMKRLDLKALEEVSRTQESTRLRIATLETRRRGLVNQLAQALRIRSPATLTQIAEKTPEARQALLALRQQLRSVMTELSGKAHVAGRVAGAVLGHLNTVVRLIAGAVEQPGVYTKHGSPSVPGRIGLMEAVG